MDGASRRRHESGPTTAVVATILAILIIGGALAGTAGALPDSNTVFSDDIVNGQVRSADIKNGGVRLADLDITVTQVDVSTPALNAGQCAFVIQTFSDLRSDEGVLAYTGSGWDSRLMVTGVESVGATVKGSGQLALQICNYTSNSNLGAGVGPVVLLRF